MKVTNNLDAIQIFINGKQVSHDAVDQWELKRMRKVYPFLKRHGFKFDQPELTVANLDFARNHLATTKMQKTPDQLRAMLKRRYHIGALAAKVMVNLSRGKRKFCMTEFFIKTDIPVSEFLERVTRIVMEETTQNFFLNLATNPDLLSGGGSRQHF